MQRHTSLRLAPRLASRLAQGGLTAVVVFVIAGCPPPPVVAPPPPPCVVGQQQACDCEYGSGTQSCEDTGTNWETCLCPVQHMVPKADVTVLGPSSADFVLAEDGRLSLPRAGNEVLTTVPAGTVIVSLEGIGFVRKIVQVIPTTDGFDVLTAPATLTDAFEELDVKVSGPITIYGGLTDEMREVLNMPKAGEETALDGVSLALGADIDADISVDPGSHLDLELWVDFELKLRPTVVPIEAIEIARAIVHVSAGAVLTTTVSIEGALSVEAGLDIISTAQKAAGIYPSNGINIPIGGGVSATMDIAFGCELAIGGSLAVTTTLEGGIACYGGVEWDDDENRFDTHKGFEWSPAFSVTLDAVDYEAYSSFGCSLHPKIGLTFLGLASAAIDAGPNVTSYLSVSNDSYNLDIVAGADGALSAEVVIDYGIDELELLSTEFPLFDITFQPPLLELDFAVCGDGLLHLDEVCDPGFILYGIDGSEAERCIPAGQPGACTCADGFEPIGPSLPQYNAIYDAWTHGRNYCVTSCGNGVVDDGEFCDMGNLNGLGCSFCSSDCTRIVGAYQDGIADPECGSVCDDGNDDNCDACPNFGFFINGGCGDGIVHTACGEQCDDGNNEDDDGCSSDCRVNSHCGDGIVGDDEECDDGNSDNCDECTTQCKVSLHVCGDGYVCDAEECDVWGWEWAGCDLDCTLAFCGDGTVNASRNEACDDGEPTATCRADCQLSVCGDNVINPLAGEECDVGLGNSPWCNPASADPEFRCKLSTCGDGYHHVGKEACDDGDVDDCTPGCNAACTGPAVPNACGDGVLRCGELCDDGADNGTYGFCATGCDAFAPRCGDGNVDAVFGEICDDGNTTSGDGCRSDCLGFEVCGDLLADFDEACDDGDAAVCKGPCNEDCTGFYEQTCGNDVIEGCEVCEDTASLPGSVDDGCTASAPNCNGCGVCSSDVCGDGIVGPSEFCEPTNMICNDQSGNTCTVLDTSLCALDLGCIQQGQGEGLCAPTCLRIQTCGDGFIDGTEFCDDMGALGGCRNDCTGLE